MTLSTHVLDLDAGRPVAGLRVTATRGFDTSEADTFEAVTDESGRIPSLVGPEDWRPGLWRIVFETAEHAPFFQQITTEISVTDPSHHHVPLLLARHGYSIYRGS